MEWIFYSLNFPCWIQIRIWNTDQDPDPGGHLNTDPDPKQTLATEGILYLGGSGSSSGLSGLSDPLLLLLQLSGRHLPLLLPLVLLQLLGVRVHLPQPLVSLLTQKKSSNWE